jgi:folate-dependent phosphoribosylglycinamide formyltransferase PurN
MKIVLWIGNESNQLALANKINELYKIECIFLEKKSNKRQITIGVLIQKILEKIFFTKISMAWFKMLSHYNKLASHNSNITYFDVEYINSEDVYLKTKLINPDLIIVSGTRLIKDKLLSLNPKIGILNLHTGLSPYVKGGPNCTNWCIANNEFHLIGNTIMWIDRGIDSGNIVTTELTPLNGLENLAELHLKVMEHAHSLYLRAINEIIKGNISNVPQCDIAPGKVFYTIMCGISGFIDFNQTIFIANIATND